MFVPRNVPLKIKDVTYNISFDLGMKQIEIPKPEELKHGTLSVIRIFVYSIFLPFSCQELCNSIFICGITTFTSTPLSFDKLLIIDLFT